MPLGCPCWVLPPATLAQGPALPPLQGIRTRSTRVHLVYRHYSTLYKLAGSRHQKDLTIQRGIGQAYNSPIISWLTHERQYCSSPAQSERKSWCAGWLGPGSQRSTPPHPAALPAQSPTGRRSVSRLRRCNTRTRQGWLKDRLVPWNLLAVCTYRLYLSSLVI